MPRIKGKTVLVTGGAGFIGSHLADRLLAEGLKSRLILTVQELGCGIVPVDAFDREWREVTGRICCELAKRAQAVYRMTCGIPARLK